MLDTDEHVPGILVFTHHPPFSNDPFTCGGGQHVSREIASKFAASTKTLAMISGHAHGYERFFENGKHFLVSGGGGGPHPGYLLPEPPIDLLAGPKRRAGEHRTRRLFNYLMTTTDEDGVRIAVQEACDPRQPTTTVDEIRIPFP